MYVNGDSDMICVPQQYSSNYIPSCTFLDHLQPKIWLEYILNLIRNNLNVVLDNAIPNSQI